MKLNYRPEIDGLRAIAVLSVILYHAQITILNINPFKGGFIGVDIFFVISGYLITSIILKELISTGTFSFKYFYERRIRRILPALLLVILVSAPIAWMYLVPVSFVSYAQSVLYSLGFSSNLYFDFISLKYQAEDSLLIPLLHTWSLSVEEQYYILFPFFLLVIFKYFRKHIIFILVIGFLISLFASHWGSINRPNFTFYSLPTRGWELLAGSILAYFESKLGSRSSNQKLNLILPVIGLILIFYSIFFFHDEMLHPSLYTLPSIIGVCLIIWFSKKNELITNILSSKLFVKVGLLSYSLYLWHYPIFAFARTHEYNNEDSVNKLFLALIILFLSIVSYNFVERPARNKKNKFKPIFLSIISVYLILILTSILIINNNGYKSRFHKFLDKEFYSEEHTSFEVNYNYNNFDDRKNIFIIGNSYTEDLLEVFNFNEELRKKFYFYLPSAKKRQKDETNNYSINCVEKFLQEKITNCNLHNFTTHMNTQYDLSNFIIFTMRGNNSYLDKKMNRISEYLKKDNKKFIVLLDDINGADILDKFVYKFKKIPTKTELNSLEERFYISSINFQKENLKAIKVEFKKNRINFVTRSDIYCNHKSKKCPLLTSDNEKIFADDYNHLTKKGAELFSKNILKLIEKLE
jgi:peptidoglycan/LPS O-acetylase OafA/YrhL